MADANHSLGAAAPLSCADRASQSLELCRSVSLHLEAIHLLGSRLAGVKDPGSSWVWPYEFCLAFSLLAQAAQAKANEVEEFFFSLSGGRDD